MTFTNSSFLMSLLFSNVLLIQLCILFQNTKFMIDIGYRLLAVFLAITLLRFLFPFEIAFSTNILLPEILSRVIIFIKTPHIAFGRFSLSIWSTFLIIWLIGSAVTGIRLLRSYRHFNRMIQQLGTDISAEEPYESLLRQICQKRHKKNRFRIVKLPGIGSPMVTGFRNPYILLPEHTITDQQDLYYILSHEAAHIFHHDMVIKFLSQILCVIYWWNPFVKQLKKQISTMLELRVDFILTNSSDPQIRVNYLESLLRAAKMEQHTTESAISFCNTNESLLKQRFSMIIRQSQKQSRWKQILLSVVFVGLYAFSIFFIFEPSYMSPENVDGSFVPTPENSYLMEMEDGIYHFYFEGDYIVDIDTISEDFADLPIYQNPKEN